MGHSTCEGSQFQNIDGTLSILNEKSVPISRGNKTSIKSKLSSKSPCSRQKLVSYY